MKRTILALLFLGLPICGAAAPHYAFAELPTGVVLGEPGALSIALGQSSMGWEFRWTASLFSRADVAVRVTGDNLFQPEFRVQLIRDLLPLQASALIGSDSFGFATTLLLGPVHVTFGRTWLESLSRRYGYTQWAATQHFTVIVGVEHQDGRWGPILGLRLHSKSSRLWGGSIIYYGGELRLSIGGAF